MNFARLTFFCRLGFASEGFNEYDNNNGDNSKKIKINLKFDYEIFIIR